MRLGASGPPLGGRSARPTRAAWSFVREPDKIVEEILNSTTKHYTLYVRGRCSKFTDEMNWGRAGLEPPKTEVGGFTVPCNCRYATPPDRK